VTERRNGSTYLLDYSFDELDDMVRGWGFKRANSIQLFKRLQRRGTGFRVFAGQKLPQSLLARLDSVPVDPIQTSRAFPSGDGSTKYAIHFRDDRRVEAVHMPFNGRNTYCISSQVGCAMGCGFCATAAMGLVRQLSPGEIVAQVLHLRRLHPDPIGLTRRFNVVFMGMGEPLHNLSNVMKAFDILTHRHGLVMAERDIGVSTAGLVPAIEKLGRFERRPQLMVSLGATRDEQRSEMMPLNKAYPLERLTKCLEDYPLRKKERIMLSYVLIAGVNDDPADARRLAEISGRFPSLVNLIPMNAHAFAEGWREPDEARIAGFYEALMQAGAFVTIRRSRGRDVAAACGQLAQVEV